MDEKRPIIAFSNFFFATLVDGWCLGVVKPKGKPHMEGCGNMPRVEHHPEKYHQQ